MLANRDRLAEGIARAGLDALVATTAQNVEYAAGYDSERLHNFVALQAYAIVRPEGAPTIVLPSTEMVHLASKGCEAGTVCRYGSFFVMREPDVVLTAQEERLVALMGETPAAPGPVEALAEALRSEGLADGRIGIDEDNFSFVRAHELRALLPSLRVEPAARWFRFARMVKTEAEIGRLAEVARINEAALAAALERTGVGASEDEAYVAFRETMAKSGATPRLWGTSSGRNSSCFFWPADRRLENGDLVRIDCGGPRRGYWSDTGVTAVCGAPHPEHVRRYDALKLAIEAGVEAARPGAPVSAVAEAVMAVAAARGLPDLERHHCGHGIGRELYEAPMLVRARARSDIFAGGFEDVTLEAGMVLNVEAPYYRLGFGGLHLEHTVLVRPGGPELLTGDRSLRIR